MTNEEISIKTPEFVSLQFQPAGLGSRALAFMIDQFVLTAINTLIVVALVFFMTGQESFLLMFDTPMIPMAIAIILIFVINAGYYFVLEYFTGGRTIGKKILGIRVIQENGHSITLLSSFIRNLMRIVDSLPAGYLVGIIMIFAHDQHKRLGDVVAGTLVVHERGQKGKKKNSNALQEEIVRRNLTKNDVDLDEWKLKSFGAKEWQLLKAYSERFLQLPYEKRRELTRQLAEIILYKVGVDTDEKTIDELENLLLVVYLKMQDEWEYEL